MREKSHRCNDCGKDFSGRSKLNLHNMTLTGEKTYVMCVVRDAVIVHIFTFIRESIQEESPINVMSVVRTSLQVQI